MTGRSAKRGRGKRKGQALPRRTPRDLSLPVEALTWQISEEEDGARLDRFLCERLPWRSRTSVTELLAEGQVTRNEQVATKKATRLKLGDTVSVAVPPPQEEDHHEELGLELARAILHEDDDLLALDKPPGLVVHMVGRIRVNTLIQGLHWLYHHGPRRPTDGSEPQVPRICHRLDRDTSGVLVLAKNQRARTQLQYAFEGRDDVEKEYLGVVSGRVVQESGTIDLSVGPDDESEIELAMTTRPDGVPARTDFTLLERFGAVATSLRFRIHTGRQHQIRVHARALGHPILLDRLYGDGRQRWPASGEPVIARQALHAEHLRLLHPRTAERLALTAPLPADLSALLAGLRFV